MNRHDTYRAVVDFEGRIRLDLLVLLDAAGVAKDAPRVSNRDVEMESGGVPKMLSLKSTSK